MHILIPNIINIIYRQLDFINQSNLKLISKDFVKYPITNLFNNVPPVGVPNSPPGYLFIIKLNAGHNNKITNINHLRNLRILGAGYNCGIRDN